MSRPLSSPPFPISPESWFAVFRRRAEVLFGEMFSPEGVGERLGVSSATVRRWEKGTATPTDEDLVRFGGLCGLSYHQIAFLRIAFGRLNAPLAPDHLTFCVNTEMLLTRQRVPMILLDEFMYARAWNSYVSILGEHANWLIVPDRHPLECFFDLLESQQIDTHETTSRAWKAVRSFWRFSAHYTSTPEYKELLEILHSYPRFEEMWSRLADISDSPASSPWLGAMAPRSSAIDMNGVAELILPWRKPKFMIVHSICSYPPLFSAFEFHPANEQAVALLEDIRRSQAEPRVFFSNEDHWSRKRSDSLSNAIVAKMTDPTWPGAR